MAKVVTKIGIEENGKLIVPTGLFSKITPVTFDDGTISDKLFVVRNGEGDDLLLINPDFQHGYATYGGFYRFAFSTQASIVISTYSERHGEKWALVNPTTLIDITNYKYNSIVKLSDEYYKTEIDGLLGVIDKSGNEILPNKFSSINFNKDTKTFTTNIH